MSVPAGVLVFLAVIGAVALLYRLVRTLLGVGIALAEATSASGLAEVSARRGDLSLLAERRDAQQHARRAGLRHALFALLWFLLLVVPLLLGWAREAYALASLVWLLPRQPVRSSPAPPRGT